MGNEDVEKEKNEDLTMENRNLKSRLDHVESEQEKMKRLIMGGVSDEYLSEIYKQL